MTTNTIPLGIYRHYKGNKYEVIGFAKHSETLEDMVIYKALYGDGGTWVRPFSMWENLIEVDGKTVKRFEKKEDWGVDITAQGEIFSIDYLIGETDCLRLGYGKEMILLLLNKLRLLGAKTVIVLPDTRNTASNRALKSAGFMWDGARYAMSLALLPCRSQNL